MAFPYIDEENFELGTRGSFTAETDTNSKLDFPHYSNIARIPGMPAPYGGAFCMRVDLSGGTADAFVNEDTTWDMALAETQHWRFMLWVDPNIVMADTNEFNIFALRSAAAYEVVCAINFTTANGLRIGVGKLTASSFLALPTGRWVAVDISVTIDNDANDDGTIDFRLDGAAATQVASLNQLAVTTGRLGTMAIDAGTTAGVILFDAVITDDARVFHPIDRFKNDVLLTASGHAFVGSGTVENVSLMSGNGTNNVVTIYDTDTGNTDDAYKTNVELKNTAANELIDPAGMSVRVRRGAYVLMSGTDPRARVKFSSVPAWGSDGAIRSYGLRRKGGTAV